MGNPGAHLLVPPKNQTAGFSTEYPLETVSPSQQGQTSEEEYDKVWRHNMRNSYNSRSGIA